MKQLLKKQPLFGLLFSLFVLYGYAPLDPPKKKKFKVVLDAGHGGHDPGNVGNGYKEKDIALKIVLAIGAFLEKNEDIEVVYTRKTDKFVDLFMRGKIANDANADLFVSVHCNSHNSKAHGTETFVLGLHANQQNFEVAKAENEVIYLEENYETKYAAYDINSPESVIGLTIMQEEFLDQSIEVAKNIQDGFTNKLRRVNRGVKQAGFIVLHQTFMPSVLVETGFLTYKPEGRYLNSATGQGEMAKSIAFGIVTYKKSIEENVGNDFSYETGEINPITNETETLSENKNVLSTGLVTFKVQLAAGATLLETKAYNFKGLSPISKEKFNNIYRYFYGAVNTLEEAKELQTKAKKKGYTSAFIVAYKNGLRITIDEALKSIRD
ncbi:N-acetylmuramoyl-L-alanine amidase [Leptobacterium sp. I13]|uniref:N-acetylmuramoyl-L-alanine amidase n=1 Tax=Leptobacterium meishanense TaxID=3128904 RepID=UPI0030EDC699